MTEKAAHREAALSAKFGRPNWGFGLILDFEENWHIKRVNLLQIHTFFYAKPYSKPSICCFLVIVAYLYLNDSSHTKRDNFVQIRFARGTWVDRTVRQKHDSALYATWRHNRWRHCNCQPDIWYIWLTVAVTSTIVASSCIKDSKQRDVRWVQKPKCSFILCEKWLLYWIATVMKILYNAVKRLREGHIFFKCDKMS